MGKIEDLILQSSSRGMDILRPHLAADFCSDAARAILAWPRGRVVLTTGFYVAGHAETDGPPGALLLAQALGALGFSPLVVTDGDCRGYFEEFGVAVQYVDHQTDYAALLDSLAPVGLIAVERCGKNIRGDYANSLGRSIAHQTAPVDRLFDLAACPTIGIGDGGNEIGMGNLASVIAERLSLVPCRTKTDHLIIATVSNWGALGLCAALGQLPTEQAWLAAYKTAQGCGFVDGITRECALSEDGFALDVGLALRQDLQRWGEISGE